MSSMERKHSKMHVMVMHLNEVVTVKDSEYKPKDMIETHRWDQEAAAKTPR
jgi:queuine/archaeosine tRNA-ribosyltransferase